MGNFIAFVLYLFILFLGTYGIENKKLLFKIENLLLSLIALFSTAFFITFYFSFEKNIPFYDSVVYWGKSIELVKGLSNNLGTTLDRVYKSLLFDDYTDLPALALTPFASFLGKKFSSYNLVVSIFYLLPIQCLLMLLIRDIVTFYQLTTKWSKTAIFLFCLCCPYLYIALIRGYLDCIGLIFVIFFLRYALFYDHSKVNWKWIIVVSLNLTFLAFSRRWYSFWIISFWVSYIIIQTIQYGLDPDSRDYKRIKNLFISSALSAILVLSYYYIFFKAYVTRVLTNNFSDMYSAYLTKSGLSSFFDLVGFFGFFPFFLSIAGIVWALKIKGARYMAIFLVLQMILYFLLFNRMADFGIHHYYLITGPFLLIACIGYCFLFSLLVNNNAQYKVLGILVLLSLPVLNFASYFIPGVDTNAERFKGFFGYYRSSYPIIRNDYQTINQMVSDINSLTIPERKRVYILASSYNLNYDLLKHADMPDTNQALYGQLWTKDVDKRDGFPLDLFYFADFVLTALPVQIHLDSSGQQVVNYFTKSITNNQRLGRYYKEVRRYKVGFDKNIDAILYEKILPISLVESQKSVEYFKILYPSNPILHTQVNLHFYSFPELGDGFSLANVNNDQEVFVHPGTTKSTLFSINYDKTIKKAMFSVVHQDSLAAKNSADPLVNGEIGFKVYIDDQLISDNYITWRRQVDFSFDMTNKSIIRFEITKGKFTDSYDGFLVKNLKIE